MNRKYCLSMKSFFWAIMVLVCCLVLSVVESVGAENKDTFPTKTIRVIVPFNPGAASDMEVRAFLPYVSKYLGVKMLVENVPGAGGKVGVSKAWKSDHDGYTLLYNDSGLSIMNAHQFRGEFIVREFVHVRSLVFTNLVLVVHPDNWKTAEEIFKDAKERTLSGGISAPGGSAHIYQLIAIDKFGWKVRSVPFSGAGEVLLAIAGKHVDFGNITTSGAQPMSAAGKVRPLFVFSDEPDPVFPDLPYPKKMGYDIPTGSLIRGFVAPPKTPANRAKILSDAMLKATQDPGFAALAKKAHMNINSLDGPAFLAETEKRYVFMEPYKKLFAPVQ